MCRCVSTTCPSVMEHAQVPEVDGRLYPGAYFFRVGDSRVVNLKRSKADAILQAELHVRVMKLQARLLPAARRRRARASLIIPAIVIANTLTYIAAGRSPGLPVVMIEVHVVRITGARRMRRIVDNIVMPLHRRVRRHALSICHTLNYRGMLT